MLEHGNPNPYASDIHGITPLHVACAKLDWETFEDLIKIGGDPLLPDHDGNTFLHLLCEGGIKDVEYDFAKMACQQFNIRLTRNKVGRTPLNILKGMMTSKSVHVRGGQPNYKRKLQENLEKILSNNLSFEDHESNNELHESIIEGDMESFKSIVQKEGFIHTDMINVRNSEGKSPLFLMVEYCRKDMFDLILELKYYEYMDLYSKDS
jgi:ankyrin repeat protein